MGIAASCVCGILADSGVAATCLAARPTDRPPYNTKKKQRRRSRRREGGRRIRDPTRNDGDDDEDDDADSKDAVALAAGQARPLSARYSGAEGRELTADDDGY